MKSTRKRIRYSGYLCTRSIPPPTTIWCNVDPCLQTNFRCPQSKGETISPVTSTISKGNIVARDQSEEPTITSEEDINFTETASVLETLTIPRSSKTFQTPKTYTTTSTFTVSATLTIYSTSTTSTSSTTSTASRTSTVSRTSTASRTSPHSSSSSLSTLFSVSTPAPGADALTSPTSPSTPTAAPDSSGSHGMTISVSTLVGIVLSCSFFAIFVSLSAFWWWSRRRRRKSEKQEEAKAHAHAQAERVASSGGGNEPVSPELELVFNPLARIGPGSVFDRTEGRMGKGESVLGLSPLAHGQHHSGTLASGAHSSLASPLTPNSSWGPGLPSRTPELDSAQIHEAATGPWAQTERQEVDARPVPRVEAKEGLRATLNSTQEEREAGTYATSWTRFQNVQL